MNRFAAAGLAIALMMLGSPGWVLAEHDSLSFKYEGGVKGDESGLRVHEAEIPEVSGEVYVYGSFDMCPVNPVPYEKDVPKFLSESAAALFRGEVIAKKDRADEEVSTEKTTKNVKPARYLQVITLGWKTGKTFESVIKFGLVDDGRAKKPNAFITPWVTAGGLDYYSLYARPNTPYDYKIRLDLKTKQMSVSVSGQGDDDWYLITENSPINSDATTINHVRVEQYPGAAGIRDVMVRSQRQEAAEKVRPHPLAKKNRVVAEDRGFKFQSMRSVWSKPGRHVTIMRRPPRWYGFPDVCQVDSNTLACAFIDGERHGGGGALFVSLSHDLGRTWEEPAKLYEPGLLATHIQRLNDGSLLVLTGTRGSRDGSGTYIDNLSYRSYDGGKTWTDERWHLADKPWMAGRGNAGQSRVVEMPDGSWLKATMWMNFNFKDDTGEPLQNEIWRSTDQGKTWQRLADVKAFPPHHLNEPTIVRLPDGRLMMVERENRNDMLPSTCFYSGDEGKTWEMHELPFHLAGRSCAGLLRDGRIMVTSRSGCGRSALWAWIDDPDHIVPFRATGAHFNDRYSVGLKDGALHIDSDGVRGQCTRYYLRAPDTTQCKIDLTFEVKVVENAGHAATISISHVGQFRLFPDRIWFEGESALHIPVTPGKFHTYRFVRVPGRIRLYIDGEQALDSTNVGEGPARYTIHGRHLTSFGNEPRSRRTNIYPDQIPPEVTGYSIWKGFRLIQDDPVTGRKEMAWSAQSGEFPDQYQLDHMIEVHASAVSHDQGYCGWIEMGDGRILVVDYTDDTAPPIRPGAGPFGVAWIRGTFLDFSDLPPTRKK